MPLMMNKGYMPNNPVEKQEEDMSAGGRMLALQNLLGAISELADEDIKPYIEDLQRKIHLKHEEEEGDDIGVEEAQEYGDDKMGSKPSIDIAVGMGIPKKMNKKGMDDEEYEDDEDTDSGIPKNGFLAILSKRMKGKGPK